MCEKERARADCCTPMIRRRLLFNRGGLFDFRLIATIANVDVSPQKRARTN